MNEQHFCQSVTGIVIRDHKVLLARHTYGVGKNRLIVPGGYVEPGETPQQALKREYMEETGIVVEPKELIGIRFNQKDWYVAFSADYVSGHAVYTLSDPRAVILKEYARSLSEEKGLTEEFMLYSKVEQLASELLTGRKNLHKPICCNVDFYSGFVYSMLGIPTQMFTPIFAISRIAGWSAHRIEELVNEGKIIRPAYKYVGHHRAYVPLDER